MGESFRGKKGAMCGKLAREKEISGLDFHLGKENVEKIEKSEN